MNTAHVVTVPAEIEPHHLGGRTVVVFDVIRATTVITTALANGAERVRVFDGVDAARAAHAAHDGPKLLAGERHSVRPEGFDLGNSPREVTAGVVRGKTVFMTTTNGTHALVAAAGKAVEPDARPAHLLAGCVENAQAVADLIASHPAAGDGADATLICAGTDRLFSFEDFVGCGAVAHRLRQTGRYALTDAALAAQAAYLGCGGEIAAWFVHSQGGRNVVAVGNQLDIAACATPDRLRVVGRVDLSGDGLSLVRA